MRASRLSLNLSPAFSFVLTMGLVNLFADMTYEGGGSINGQFLGTLGAGAAIISIAAGFGEFLGYALRSVSGYVADKTARYWLITFLGYTASTPSCPSESSFMSLIRFSALPRAQNTANGVLGSRHPCRHRRRCRHLH